VAVVGVLAEAAVGDQNQIGVGGLDRANRLLHSALRIPGTGAFGVLLGRNTEEEHRWNSKREALCRFGESATDRLATDARHCIDRLRRRKRSFYKDRQH
jgi:hypothetical protein